MNDEWLKAKDLYLRRLKPSTRRAYATGIAHWSAFCRNCGVDLQTAGRATMEAWLLSMKESGLKDTTIMTRVAGVSGFYRFCMLRYTFVVDGHELSLASFNPADTVRIQVNKYGKSQYLTAGELRSILDQIDLSDAGGRRDYALLLGYALTGRRNSEWRCLRAEDITIVDGVVTYRWSGKGRSNELYEMPELVYQAVKALDVRQGYIFKGMKEDQPISNVTANNILKRYAAMAKIQKKVHIHMLRHGYAMLARELGADTLTISESLAHANTSTTQIYLTHMAVQRDTLSQRMAVRMGLR